jgi:hypothetical protein
MPAACVDRSLQLSICAETIQGGSDKSGILKIFLETHTAQLKII